MILLRIGWDVSAVGEVVESHGGRTDDVSIYGQESKPTTWRLVAMNLAIRVEGRKVARWPDTGQSD
jgi:type I restriction-modification system DNA methylase subunit